MKTDHYGNVMHDENGKSIPEHIDIYERPRENLYEIAGAYLLEPHSPKQVNLFNMARQIQIMIDLSPTSEVIVRKIKS